MMRVVADIAWVAVVAQPFWASVGDCASIQVPELIQTARRDGMKLGRTWMRKYERILED